MHARETEKMEIVSRKHTSRDGVTIYVPSISRIEPSTDGKTTIVLTDGGIGTMDRVDSEITMGGPDGMVVTIGDALVIKTTKTTKKIKGSGKITL